MNSIAKFSAVALALALGGCRSAPSTEGIPSVKGFDAARYMGTWHEIARLPQSFERDLRDVTATYWLEDETLHIVNRGVRGGREKTATAVGHFAGASDVGAFRVSFFRPFYGDYRIVWISPDYDLAMVTSSDKSSFWILARRKDIPSERLEPLVAQAGRWGIDVSALEYP